jgi:Zn-finger nucleic acid-binding protein
MIPCPNCRNEMQSENLERHDHGLARVDLCFACGGLWFDHLVSAQLAPAAVISLFKEIYAHRDDVRQPLSARMNCPHCRGVLALSYDLGKAGRFSYFTCPKGHGRYTPFFQFLREKQFVRSLTPVELQQVRAQVRQIRCSECGAPVDLEHQNQCSFCHAPVSFLDSEAVEKAVRMWSERRDVGPTPQTLADVLHPARHTFNDRILLSRVERADLLPDLVSWGIHAIGKLF